MTTPTDTTTQTSPAAQPSGTQPPAPSPQQSGSTQAEASPNPPPASNTPAAPEGTSSKPSAVDVKLPDGLKLDEKSVGTFKALAGELGLDSPKAQKLVDFYAGVLSAQQEAATAAFEKLEGEWKAAMRADKDVGNGTEAGLKAALEAGQRAVAKYGGEELQHVLDASGLGNHPALVRAFVRIGRALAEDSVKGGIPAGNGATPTEEQKLRAMYPNSPELFTTR